MNGRASGSDAAGAAVEEVVGGVKLRPTRIGIAVLAGGAVAFYQGLTRQPVAFGSALALLAVLWVDGLVGLFRLQQTEVDVAVFRRVGTADDGQPTVRVHRTGGRFIPKVGLRPMIDLDPPSAFEPVDDTGTVLAFAGDHPIAHDHLVYDVSLSAMGLVLATRTHMRRTRRPLCRGPSRGEQHYAVPDLNAAADIARVREYVPGDRFSRVNWAATARTGDLHVRDEQRILDEVRVLILLVDEGGDRTGHDDPATRIERVKTCLSLARNIGQGVLDQGRSLRLITTEIDGRFEHSAAKSARVVDRRRPAPTGTGRPVVNDGYVVDSTELLQRLSMAEPTGLAPAVERPYVMLTTRAITVVR